MRLTGFSAGTLWRIARRLPFGWRSAAFGKDERDLSNQILASYGQPDEHENFVYGRSALLYRNWNMILYVDWENLHYEEKVYDDVDEAWRDYPTLREGINALAGTGVAAVG